LKKELGFKELLAIAIGGMVGGGIFTILGIAAGMVGFLAPFAIALGGVLAGFASYAYVKLGLYYKDEGGTYSFFKRTFTSHLGGSIIGWFTIFGYISTLAIYSYTFSSYAISGFSFGDSELIRKIVAVGILGIFMLINLWSVKGMGEIEDIMVYAKLLILTIISFALILFAKTDFNQFVLNMQKDFHSTSFLSVLIVSSVTFVAYEGFELVVNAVNEMKDPDKNIPRAIYWAVGIVSLIYFIVALSAVFSISLEDLIKYKESALATGAYSVMGEIGRDFVIFGAILATSSAINSTLFGASRQMAKVAQDGYLPKFLSKKVNSIPKNAVIAMAFFASFLIFLGGLRLIVEFGSITFILVSLLIAFANLKIYKQTNSSFLVTLLSIIGLGGGAILILYYEYQTKLQQLIIIAILYLLLSLGAWGYSKIKEASLKLK